MATSLEWFQCVVYKVNKPCSLSCNKGLFSVSLFVFTDKHKPHYGNTIWLFLAWMAHSVFGNPYTELAIAWLNT